MDSVDVVSVHLRAMAGALLNDALREATLLALTERRQVELIHNSTVFWIVPQAIYDMLHDTSCEKKD